MDRSVLARLFSSLTAVLALSLATFAQADPLLIGILDSPTMGYRSTDNQLLGFEAELAQQICERSHLECEFVLQPFALNLESVRDGKLDMAFSSILVTEARKQHFVFSERYMRSVSSYIGNPGKQPRYRPVRVAVVKDSVQEVYLKQSQSAAFEALSFSNVDEAYQALKTGQADRVLLPAIIQLGFLYSDDSGLFDLIGEPLDNPKLAGDVAVAIHPDRAELKSGIDEALKSLLVDGSFNRLNNKYFPFNIY